MQQRIKYNPVQQLESFIFPLAMCLELIVLLGFLIFLSVFIFPIACCYQHVHCAYSKENHLEAIHLTCCR